MLKVEFEGTDGAGKTTGLKYFIEQARAKGLKVVETREVGNPHIPACVRLRELVLNPDNKLSGEAMELIFSAMRFENDKWLQSLDKDVGFVVSDRGFLSHLAYTDHNVSSLFTKELYIDFMSQKTQLPDVVIYFDINTETALKRRTSRGTTDVIEMKGVEFQEKVRESFEQYMGAYDGATNINGIPRIYSIDANETKENVRMQLDYILNELTK